MVQYDTEALEHGFDSFDRDRSRRPTRPEGRGLPTAGDRAAGEAEGEPASRAATCPGNRRPRMRPPGFPGGPAASSPAARQRREIRSRRRAARGPSPAAAGEVRTAADRCYPTRSGAVRRLRNTRSDRGEAGPRFRWRRPFAPADATGGRRPPAGPQPAAAGGRRAGYSLPVPASASAGGFSRTAQSPLLKSARKIVPLCGCGPQVKAAFARNPSLSSGKKRAISRPCR